MTHEEARAKLREAAIKHLETLIGMKGYALISSLAGSLIERQNFELMPPSPRFDDAALCTVGNKANAG
jgi:hypothetical protein